MQETKKYKVGSFHSCAFMVNPSDPPANTGEFLESSTLFCRIFKESETIVLMLGYASYTNVNQTHGINTKNSSDTFQHPTPHPLVHYLGFLILFNRTAFQGHGQ